MFSWAQIFFEPEIQIQKKGEISGEKMQINGTSISATVEIGSTEAKTHVHLNDWGYSSDLIN